MRKNANSQGWRAVAFLTLLFLSHFLLVQPALVPANSARADAPILLTAVKWFASWLGGYLITKAVDNLLDDSDEVERQVAEARRQLEFERRHLVEQDYTDAQKRQILLLLDEAENLFRNIDKELERQRQTDAGLRKALADILKDRINPLERRVDDLEEEIARFGAGLDQVEREVSDIKTRVDLVETRLNRILFCEIGVNLLMVQFDPILDNFDHGYHFQDEMLPIIPGAGLQLGVLLKWHLRISGDVGWTSNTLDKNQRNLVTVAGDGSSEREVRLVGKGLVYGGSCSMFIPWSRSSGFGLELGAGIRAQRFTVGIDLQEHRVSFVRPLALVGIRGQTQAYSFFVTVDALYDRSAFRYDGVRIGVTVLH